MRLPRIVGTPDTYLTWQRCSSSLAYRECTPSCVVQTLHIVIKLTWIVEQEVEVSSVGEFEVAGIVTDITGIVERSGEEPTLDQDADFVDGKDGCVAGEYRDICIGWILGVQDICDDGA